MTNKYTKRQYQKDLAEINAKIEEVDKKLIELENCNIRPIPLDMIDKWNGLYDQRYDLKQERNSIQMRYDRRNWTSQDYQMHELIMQNID